MKAFFKTGILMALMTVVMTRCSEKITEPDSRPTVTVGAQDGTLTAGRAGSVTFPLTTANIADGNYAATVSNLPAGVTVQGQVAISNSSGTLTLAGNTSTTQGTASTLRLTVDNTQSAPFTLSIVAPGNPDAPFDGAGTASDPYLISSAAELASMRDLINSDTQPYASADRFYSLTANIDLGVAPHNSGAGWTPIGRANSNPFRGTFDGNQKTISNLRIDATNTTYSGLFGFVTGTIQNLGLINVDIKSISFTGGVAGNLGNSSDGSAKITSCYVTGAVRGGNRVGGIAGYAYDATISHCYTACTVNGDEYVGGIVGNAGTSNIRTKTEISHCYATGAISCKDYGGGIAGHVPSSSYNDNGWVTFCMALNPSVIPISKIWPPRGRVVDNDNDLGHINNNYAFDGMMFFDGSTLIDLPDWLIPSHDNRFGANLTKAEIALTATFNTHFPDNPWTKSNGRLPGLFGNTVEMPAHLK